MFRATEITIKYNGIKYKSLEEYELINRMLFLCCQIMTNYKTYQISATYLKNEVNISTRKNNNKPCDIKARIPF